MKSNTAEVGPVQLWGKVNATSPWVMVAENTVEWIASLRAAAAHLYYELR